MKQKDPYEVLAKYLKSEDEAYQLGVDPALGRDRTVRHVVASTTFAVAYTKCYHRDVSLRELDIEPRWVGDTMYTAHPCLRCTHPMWRAHPGPRRIREPLNREEG